MIRNVICALALLFIVDVASAQCRVVRRPVVTTCATPIVHRPVVVAPIAIPVIVPATVFQYMPALQPAAVAVPAQPVAVAPQAPQPSSVDLDRIIRERVEQILRERAGDKGPPPLLLPGEQPQAQTPLPATDDINTQVANLLASKSCVQCHTAGGQEKVKGNITLFTQTGNDLFFQPSVSRQVLLAAVSGQTPRMPPTANGNPSHPTALRPDEITLLQRWVNAR